MNAYLVNCEKTGVALMIDPGDEPEKILPVLETLPIEEVQIFLTHVPARIETARLS